MTRRPGRRPRLRLLSLESRLVPNGSPVLIADIDPGSGDSDPNSFTGMGNFVYFAASTGTASTSTIGEELWKTDGTAAGTSLVKDIYPGGSGLGVHSGSPRNLTAVGSTLFFTATDGTTGVELWKTDGTTAGTQLVKDIRLGANSSNPSMLTAVGNTLYFTAADATTGIELWKSDGTVAGTVEVADLSTGSASTDFDWLANIGGRPVFARQTGMAATPTVDVFAVDPGGLTPIVSYTGTSESSVAVVGTKLFYHGLTPDPNVFNALDDTLFVVDTAAANPTPVALTTVLSGAFGFPKLNHLTAVGGKLFFNAVTDVGEEPWASDGTPGGTHLVKDINQDTPQNDPSSSPTEYTDVDGIAYFAATTIADGRELWRSDGTAAGTWEVADLALGDASSSPADLISVGGRLVFDTQLTSNTYQMWTYDPAANRMASYPDYALGWGFVGEYPFGVYNDVLYFSPHVLNTTVGLEPYELEFDPAAPAITGYDVDTGVPGDGITADNTPRLFGTATPGIRVRVFDQTTLLGTTTAGADGAWQFTTAALPDGVHTFHARAVNLNGTASADSGSLVLTIDTSAPAAPAITGFADNTGSPTDNVTNDPTPTLSGTAEPNAALEVFDGPTDLGGATVGADGQWSFTTPTLPDGTHTFTAEATDAAGNVSPASTAFPIVTDGVAPAAPAITGFLPDTGIPGDGLTDSPAPTLTGTAEPGSVVQVFDGPTALGTSTARADGTWQYSTPTLTDGPHDFTATATDVAGNASQASGVFTITVDTGRPSATVAPAIGQADPTNGSPVTFTVTFSEPVSGFTAAGIDLSASTVGGTLVANVSGSGTDYVVTVTGMTGDGAVVASVRAGAATDAAGNGNTATAGSSVHFDNVPPAVTINQAAGQADPTDDTQIQFTVTFGEPVTGFDATDVSFAGSDNPGSLSATVSGSGADYTVTVTGMSGAQTVVVSIPAGAAVDAAGNLSLASTGADNTVTYNDIGTLQFSLSPDPAHEGTDAIVTVTRTHGSRGAISVDYATGDGTARAPGDYTAVSGTKSWADGDSTPKTFSVPISADGVNEGTEFLNLVLSNPTGEAILGLQSTARIVIAPSDGTVLDPKKPTATFTDVDGDLVTVRFGGGVGTATVYLTDGKAPISEIDLNGTDATKSALAITVKKPLHGTGDGRVGLGTLTGGDLRALLARSADLTGAGIQLAGHLLGSVTIGNLLTGAGIVAGGTTANRTAISAGDFADGTTVDVGSVVSRLSAGSFGRGSVTAPSAGTVSFKGDFGGTIDLGGPLGILSVGGSVLPGADLSAASVRTIRVKHDFGGDVQVSGIGVDSGKPALGTLAVGGTVRDALISVGGNITSVTAAGFDGSRLWAGYDGTHFNVPATIATVRVTGKSEAFANSDLYATNFKSVALTSVNADNLGTPFGVFAHTSVGRVTVSLPTRRTYPGAGPLGDFEVEVI